MNGKRILIWFLPAALFLAIGCMLACGDDDDDDSGDDDEGDDDSGDDDSDDDDAGGFPLDPINKVPDSLLEIAQKFADDLDSQGYSLALGYWFLFEEEDCQTAIEVMGNCYGNNPVAPYILFGVPAWSEEFVDPATVNAFGVLEEGYSAIYRIDPQEALVIFAQLPPQAAYLGFQSYEFTRPGSSDEFADNPLYDYLGGISPAIQKQFFDTSPNPDRLRIFGSIGNSINNVVIENQSGSAFGQERFFILTPDQNMETAMKAALSDAGAPDETHIFVEPFSSDLEVGLEEEAYDFMSVMRYSMPEDLTQAEQWRQDLPMLILRVRPPASAPAQDPYPSVALDDRNATSEEDLGDGMTVLADAVKEDWGQTGSVPAAMIDMQTTFDLVGPHCNEKAMNCLGDTQDTSYMATLFLTLDNLEIYAVVGTLGTETGNATYTNLVLYYTTPIWGIESIDHTILAGTAVNYAADLTDEEIDTDIDHYYLYYITRDCHDLPEFTYIDDAPPPCTSVTEEMIPAGETARLVQRNYIYPGSDRGPDSSDLQRPLVIAFDGSL